MTLMIRAMWFIAVIAFIYAGENSICRTISCMRSQYQVGDKVCQYTTSSVSLVIGAQNGPLAEIYFMLRNIFYLPEHTIIQNERGKVIGLLTPGDIRPFEKNPDNHTDECVVVQ